uniref:Uncharacterized protein n=1 Tax=Vitrella brassicaformis TaxID=1169539 RepID=A0A7S1P290_9ALVE
MWSKSGNVSMSTSSGSSEVGRGLSPVSLKRDIGIAPAHHNTLSQHKGRHSTHTKGTGEAGETKHTDAFCRLQSSGDSTGDTAGWCPSTLVGPMRAAGQRGNTLVHVVQPSAADIRHGHRRRSGRRKLQRGYATAAIDSKAKKLAPPPPQGCKA